MAGSVAAALSAVPDRFEIVLVHDAARALAPAALVERVADAVRAGHDAVIPVLPVVDTIKRVDEGGLVSGTVDRSVLRAVQTPQGFRRVALTEAHAAAVDEHTDDAGLIEKIGGRVLCVPGDELALKITRPFDLIVANILANPLMRLAPEMARHLAPGGSLILSGILDRQRRAVLAAYSDQRFRHVVTIHREGWVTLHLKRQ